MEDASLERALAEASSVRDITRGEQWTFSGGVMTAALVLMIIYRIMALFVAVMMVIVLWRERNWREQLFATLVFVPFILRGLGVK